MIQFLKIGFGSQFCEYLLNGRTELLIAGQ